MTNTAADNLLIQLIETPTTNAGGLWSFLQHAKVNINTTNKDGYTAIQLAVKRKDVNIVKTLLDEGADPNLFSPAGNSPLHEAIKNNDEETIDLLLKSGAIFDVENSEGKTAIDLVKETGTTRSINLIQKAINNAFLDAATEGNIDKIDYYLAQGAKINVLTKKEHDSALHLALKAAKAVTAIHLIKRGIYVDFENTDQVTPLHLASIRGYTEIVKALIDKKVDINSVDKMNATAIHYAIFSDTKNAQKIVYLLIKNGADPNITPKEDFPLILKLAFRGYDEILSHCISKIKDINISNQDNYTALHAAIMNGSFEIVQILVNNGVDINIITTNKLYYQKTYETEPKIAEFLNLKSTKLISAAANGHSKIVKHLFKQKYYLSELDKNLDFGYLPLTLAIKNGHNEIVTFLIDNGVKVTPNFLGNSPLHTAAKYEQCHIFNILIDYGCNPYAENLKGISAFNLTNTCKVVGDSSYSNELE